MLCLCMLMSAMAVGLNVFAQEKSEAVARFEANVEAFDGYVTKAEPSAEDLAAYEKLVAKYKALGNSDKESVDVMVFDVFYHHVVMRERQISIKNHPEISSSKKDHYINAAAQAVTTLGYVPAYIDNAVELAKTIADRKISVDDKKAAWKAADYNTRVMAGGYGSTRGIISSSVNGDAFKGFFVAENKNVGDSIAHTLGNVAAVYLLGNTTVANKAGDVTLKAAPAKSWKDAERWVTVDGKPVKQIWG